MRGYFAFLLRRLQWAKSGVWGHFGSAALVAGVLLALIAWCFPQWARQHISERMNAFVLGALPLLAGASFFLVRWILSPYSIFKHTEQQLIAERDNLKKQLDAISDIKTQHRMRERQSMYESCAKMLKESSGGLLPFNAIARVEAYKLEPEDLDWLCDELAKHYGNPFELMDNLVPHTDRKKFLRLGVPRIKLRSEGQNGLFGRC